MPALTIAPDEHLIETAAIIDYLEDTATPDRRLIPLTGEARRKCLARIACANAVVEKGVALAYEVERRPPHLQWDDWRKRLTMQVYGGLAALEAMVPSSGWMGGETPDGSDVAAVCAHDFVRHDSRLRACSRPPSACCSVCVRQWPTGVCGDLSAKVRLNGSGIPVWPAACRASPTPDVSVLSCWMFHSACLSHAASGMEERPR